MRKELGKIESVSFGFGGYQEAMLGLNLSFTMQGSGVGGFISGGWAIERSEYCKWTEEDREKQQAKLCKRIIELLNEAKISDISKLKGIPVELVFDGMSLKEWRVLVEVL
jgi:hypothetical protein